MNEAEREKLGPAMLCGDGCGPGVLMIQTFEDDVLLLSDYDLELLKGMLIRTVG